MRVALTLMVVSLFLIVGTAACSYNSNNNLASNRADTSKFMKVTSAGGKELLVVTRKTRQ